MIGQPQQRDPRDWVEDMAWHRRMFAESHFRWAPEDPYALALTWTRGRLVYESIEHFRLLDKQIYDLNVYAVQIEDAIAPLLAEAHERCNSAEWGRGLDLVGLTSLEVQILRHSASPQRGRPHPEVRRALRGIPLPNPFSQVWELRQMRAMYQAAENVLEDTLCDLALELIGTGMSWQMLSLQTQMHRSARTLQLRVDDQRGLRGGPGDDRRQCSQVYQHAQ